MEVIYGRKIKEEEKEASAPTISRSMSYAEGRFGKSANNDDDSFGEDEDIMSKANMGRRGGAITSSKVQNDDSEEEKETD